MRRSDYVDERSAVEQGECAPEPVCTGGARGREPFLEPRSPELCVLTDSSSVVVSGECDHVECQGAERPSSGVSRDASDGWTQCGYRDATESGFPVSVVSMEHLVCQSSLESDHGLACDVARRRACRHRGAGVVRRLSESTACEDVVSVFMPSNARR